MSSTQKISSYSTLNVFICFCVVTGAPVSFRLAVKLLTKKLRCILQVLENGLGAGFSLE